MAKKKKEEKKAVEAEKAALREEPEGPSVYMTPEMREKAEKRKAHRRERAGLLDEIEAARRAALLRHCIEQEVEKHYSEALDGYRQIIEQYPETEEETEARERMLDLAYLFETDKQPYRSLSLYGMLEGLYEHERYDYSADARRERVEEILAKIHAEKRLEEERERRLEAEEF